MRKIVFIIGLFFLLVTNGFADWKLNSFTGKLDYYEGEGGTVAKTDVAETLTANWINITYPWADNEVANDITLTNLSQITNRSITSLTATNWRIFYSGAGGVPIELALGASGTVLQSNGASSAPTFETAGTGDVSGPASSTDNAICKFNDTTGKLIQEEDDFIVDDTGVVNPSDSPTIKGYHDTDAESVWSLGAVDADVNTATGDTTSRWKTLVGNSLTTFLSMNGTNETVDVAKPIVPSKGIGTPYEINPTSPVTIDSTICRKIFTVATSTTFNLPAEVECSTGYAKEFCFKARGTATITLNPDDADFMQFGDNASGGAGKYLVDDSGTRGDYICIFGRDSGGTDYWTDLSSIPDSAQATTWSYEP